MAFLRSLPLASLRVTDQFWSRYHRAQLERGLLAQYEKIVETGRLRNFQHAANREAGTFEGYRFNDSDVYKWIEAAAYALLHGDSPQLRAAIDESVRLIQAAQMEDGYINTFFQLQHPDMRWRNLNAMHEMYCAGHLIEAGVAMHDCLGDDRLLKVSVRFADHIASVFGPEKRRGSCGHQEIELALIKLADSTGQDRYRELARWMVEDRGRRPSYFEEELADKEAIALAEAAAALMLKDGNYTGEYLQDHLPIRDHEEVVGHAVRAMYFYIAAANLSPDAELRTALERTWSNLTKKRMYVTGGIGPSGANEGFTYDYDLPNFSAYAETCAAVGLVFWGHSLLQITGNSEYADSMERALYNGALAGISLDTTAFFYDNPLESRGQHARKEWFGCACCPPNIARLIGSIGKYAISAAESSLWIHLPIGLEFSTTLSGVETQIQIQSNYPWSGDVTLHVNPAQPVEAEVRFRIPDWADDVETEIPGLMQEAAFENGYIVINKLWQPGDTAKFNIEMKPRWVSSNPRVMDNLGRVALSYGPLIYSAEDKDLGFAPQYFLADIDSEPEIQHESLLGGITTIRVKGMKESDQFPDELYATADAIVHEESAAKFIPYFAWNNRGPSHMQVWVRSM